MVITPKTNQAAFTEFLIEIRKRNLYQHKFLNHFLKSAMTGKVIVSDNSILSRSGNGWILLLHSDLLYVYGEHWDARQFTEIQESFELNKFGNLIISGESELIAALLSCFKITKHSIDKERVMYKTKRVIAYKPKGLNISWGKLGDADELAIMLQTYYHEEYQGKNDKQIDEMKDRILMVIQSNAIYVLKDESLRLLGFCTINNPDIGILFTKQEYRGRGYGKIMLSHCAALLLKRNAEAFVLTDKENKSSNDVCKAVGFQPFYNYSSIEINVQS